MRARILIALVGLALLLALVAVWSPDAPAPQPAPPAASGELDEAAEEVRAVATAMRRLEERIAGQDERDRELRAELADLRVRMAQREQRIARSRAPEPEAAELAPAPAPAAEPLQLETLVNQAVAPFAPNQDAGTPARALVWVEPVQERRAQARLEAPGAAAAPEEDLRFVIPPAVLSGRVLTALVGRVPRGGSVQDPWPFLAVSGAGAWTANGTELPQLRGILWRGVASGDAVLGCASASVRSLVYVFGDGVFHEARAESAQGFGYLADRQGNPCLRGTVHSTRAEDLSRNLLAILVAGAGQAVAREQLSTQVGGGAQTQTLDGNAFDLFLGQSVEGAAQAYSELLARTASDAWDAVVVPAGQEVDIHLTASIPIFHQPAQRIHEQEAIPAAAVAAGGLD